MAGLGILLAITASVQAASGGPDAGGYHWRDQLDPAGCSIAGFGFTPADIIVLDTVDMQGPYDLGFSMPFAGRRVEQVWVSPHGYLSFSPQPNEPDPQLAPDPTGVNDFIAASWVSADSSTIRVEARGTYFIVTWLQTVAGEDVDTTMVLEETGRLRIAWTRSTTVGPKMVGYENLAGTEGTTFVWMEDGGALTVQADGSFPAPSVGNAACIGIPILLACNSAFPLDCGQNQLAALPGPGPTYATSYPCTPSALSGRERVFAVDVAEFSTLTVTIDDPDLELLYIADPCGELSCETVAVGGALSLPALMPGTYSFAVDAPTEAEEGVFNFSTSCEAEVTPIACGETVVGSTAGRGRYLDGYACLTGDYSGPESYFVVDFAPPGNILITLDRAGDLAAFLFEAGQPIEPSNCLRAGVGGTVLWQPPAGQYVIVVDGPSAAGGAFSLELQCSPQLGCGGAATLDCGEIVTGTTAGRTDAVSLYGCSSDVYSGGEAVFRLDNPVRQVVSLLLDDSAEPGLDLVLVSGCDEGACIRIGDTRIDRALDPGTYHVIVDGRDGAEGSFSIETFCGLALEPPVLQANGAIGTCWEEHKTARVTPDIPKADVLLTIDLTGSMGGERAELQANMQAIVNELERFIPDVAFGLVSYRDYTFEGESTTNCSYTTRFGGPMDEPYVLHQPITTDRSAILAAVESLPATGGGSDSPEASLRAFYESYADPVIAWRDGSRRLLVDFSDTWPHACNLLECLGATAPDVYGVDLGRDGLPGTDDLILLDVLDEMAAAGITMLHFDSSSPGLRIGGFGIREIWECWAQVTGGEAVTLTTNGTVPEGIDLSELIGDVIFRQGDHCPLLELRAEAGFEEWVSAVDVSYTDLALPAVVEFVITVCVPADAVDGPVEFTVELLCSGVVIATQTVQLEVFSDCDPAAVVNTTLFVRHEGDEITVHWDRVGSAARDLLRGETYRLLKTVDRPNQTFSTVNGFADTGRTYTETDRSSPLQFFDLRVANGCGELSVDEYPPG